MASTYHKTITAVGLIFLFHAAYSAAQHRSFLRLTEQEFTSLPVDIIVQGIISLFLTMYGVMYIAGIEVFKYCDYSHFTTDSPFYDFYLQQPGEPVQETKAILLTAHSASYDASIIDRLWGVIVLVDIITWGNVNVTQKFGLIGWSIFITMAFHHTS